MPFNLREYLGVATPPVVGVPPVPGPSVAPAAPEPGPPPPVQPFDKPAPRAVTERPPAQIFEYYGGTISGAGTENIITASVVPEYWVVVLTSNSIMIEADVDIYEPGRRALTVYVGVNGGATRRVIPARDRRFVLVQAGGLAVRYEVYAVSGYNPGPVV